MTAAGYGIKPNREGNSMERPEHRTLPFAGHVRTGRGETSGRWKGGQVLTDSVEKSIAKAQYATIESKSAAIQFNAATPSKSFFNTIDPYRPYEHDCLP
jgi:hypothetical protein